MLLNFTPFPVLTTERLTLRQINIEDENEIFALRSDERVNKFLDRPKANSIEDARKFIDKINNGICNNEFVMWAITLKNTNKLIGTICYWNISKEDDRAEIGYELNPGFQGKGIMQEAISKVIDFGFEIMKIETITAFPAADNNRSVQLLKKNNFKRDLKLEHDSKEQLNNLVIYALTNKASKKT